MLLSKGVLSILNNIEMLHWSPGWKMNFWTSDLLITKKKKKKERLCPRGTNSAILGFAAAQEKHSRNVKDPGDNRVPFPASA